MTKPTCDCLECKIRAVVSPEPGVPVNLVEVLQALGPVTAEVLAYCPPEVIAAYFEGLAKNVAAKGGTPPLNIKTPTRGTA